MQMIQPILCSSIFLALSLYCFAFSGSSYTVALQASTTSLTVGNPISFTWTATVTRNGGSGNISGGTVYLEKVNSNGGYLAGGKSGNWYFPNTTNSSGITSWTLTEPDSVYIPNSAGTYYYQAIIYESDGNYVSSTTVTITVTQIFTVTATAGANGSVTPTTKTVNSGGSITFTATPNSGYIVSTWLVGSTNEQTGGTSYTLNNITGNYSVTVTFIAGFTVTPSAGANGSISPSVVQNVVSGGSLTFTASPNTSCIVNNWTLDGTTVQNGGSSYTLSNITANHSVQVNFTLVTYTVTPYAGGNGAISPSSAQIVNSGGSVSFTATPTAGDVVNSWSVDGTVTQTGGATFLLSNIIANHNVTVTFSIQTFTVTPYAGVNGTISPNSQQIVNYNGSALFTAAPNSGYVVNTWSLDGTVVQTGGTTYTLVMLLPIILYR